MTLGELIELLAEIRNSSVPHDTEVLVRCHGQTETLESVMTATTIESAESRSHTIYIHGVN